MKRHGPCLCEFYCPVDNKQHESDNKKENTNIILDGARYFETKQKKRKKERERERDSKN